MSGPAEDKSGLKSEGGASVSAPAAGFNGEIRENQKYTHAEPQSLEKVKSGHL